MLQQKDPVKFLEFSDNIFIILLKSLNCSNEKIINKVLDLLSKISNQSNDKYFNNFMVDLLNLFKKDSKLLDLKSDFIIRKICKSLDPERVYKSLSDVLIEKFSQNYDDLNFISIMIQILNNNLIIAPELIDLRKKLINNNELFKKLFKCWSLNSPSLLCLALLTSNYELSYKIINQMVKYEININILVQLDLLIQLLESPIFAKLRLDLLDPFTNIYLFKCLYGLLMLLPQSNSFKILQNRLNSISPIINLPFNNNNNNHNNAISNENFQNNVENDNNEGADNKNGDDDDVDDGDDDHIDNDKLLDYFNKCQEKLQNLKISSNINDNDNENGNGNDNNNSNSNTNNHSDYDNIIKNGYSNMFESDQPLETSSMYNIKNDNDNYDHDSDK